MGVLPGPGGIAKILSCWVLKLMKSVCFTCGGPLWEEHRVWDYEAWLYPSSLLKAGDLEQVKPLNPPLVSFNGTSQCVQCNTFPMVTPKGTQFS